MRFNNCMEILDNEQSKTILVKLCDKFGYYDKVYLDKYLHSSPFVSPLLTIEKNGFPMLWFPQNSNMQFIRDIWEDVIAIENQTENMNFLDPVRNFIIPNILRMLGSENLYVAGNINYTTGVRHAVVKFQPNELSEAFRKYGDAETYFFPENLDWILCPTHEDLTFVAGNKKFIDKIKENFADYKKYEPQYWKEILGFN